jgi:hypothetical protein
MDRRRLRFVLAALLFSAWVAALAILAVTTGRRPVLKAPAAKAKAAETVAPDKTQ